MIKILFEKDIGKWVVKKRLIGKIKGYNNKKHIALIVFECENKWHKKWIDYQAVEVNYCDIELKGGNIVL